MMKLPVELEGGHRGILSVEPDGEDHVVRAATLIPVLGVRGIVLKRFTGVDSELKAAQYARTLKAALTGETTL